VSPATEPHLLDGVTAPIVTPLDRHGRPDGDAVRPLLTDLAAAGVDALLILGTNGEGPAFDPAAGAAFAGAAARAWRSLTEGRGRVLVAAFGSSTGDALARADLIRSAATPDALVVPPPHYFRYTPDELVDHYRAMARTGEPVIVYNAPRYTGNPLTAEVLTEIAALPGVAGLKDSGNDEELLRAAVRIGERVPGFGVSQGDERALASGLRQGAVGITPGLANLAPGPCVELAAAVASGDDATARQRQAELDDLARMHRIRPGVAAMKAALAILGRCSKAPAPPMRAYDAEETARLTEHLRRTPARLIGPVPAETSRHAGWA
jgi:4-hydroxy-tetrahydrodipicolinate synthase